MSRLDDFVTDIATEWNDATVQFQAGKLRLNEHAQQRVVIFVRQSGYATHSTAPYREVYGTPVSGAGTRTGEVFTRNEQIEVTLRAEDEEALDLLLDRLLEVVFIVCGANAFGEQTPYEWFDEDSTSGGGWERRQPAIKLTLAVRLKSRTQPTGYAVLATAETDLTEGTETVSTVQPAP